MSPTRATPRARRLVTTILILVVQGVRPVAAAAAGVTIVASDGDTVTLSAGASEGVTVGATGKVRMPPGAAGAPACATVTVVRVAEHASVASLAPLGAGCAAATGLEVVFDSPPGASGATSTEAGVERGPWRPAPERGAIFAPVRDAAPCADPNGTLETFCLTLQQVAPVDQAGIANEYVRAGDELFETGDWETARAMWASAAALDPGNAALAERLRKLRPVAGEKRRFKPSGAGFVFVPPGAVQIGCVPDDQECSADEKPRHAVTITRGLWVAATLTTVKEYGEFAQATTRPMPPAAPFSQSAQHPIVIVSWDDALAYCTWAGGRLPTEAEWEYAARGGSDGQKYPWGGRAGPGDANFNAVGNGEPRESTVPVGSFKPNGFGLFDMAGNAWEWCADRYGADYYASSPATDPKGPPRGDARVLRGGSWMFGSRELRASARDKLAQASRSDDVGFRCVRDDIP